MRTKARKGVKSLPEEHCFIGLVTCTLLTFFVGVRVVPAAEGMMALIDKYPTAVRDPRVWFVFASLGAWSTMGLVCAVLAQAFNKRLVGALYEED